MQVVKRNGKREKVRLSKIETRLKKLLFIEEVDKEPLKIDVTPIAIKVVDGLYDGVTTKELDALAAETAASMSVNDPDYGVLAARVEISALQKETNSLSFSEKMVLLSKESNVSSEFADYVDENKDWLNELANPSKDYLIDFFGLRTLKRSYLQKIGEKFIESPQDMWLRVAAFVHQGDKKNTIESYNRMSSKEFTHATPTLFNAGTTKPQLSSCFLLDIDSDSIGGIYKTLSDCALISQSAGGIGLAIHKIRSKGSHIRGTNGTSNGIVPMLRVFDATMRYVDQGGNKRKGSAAIYLEPWHADIFDFLDLKKNHGKEEMRARDLFYAMWIPDLFMQRVKDDGVWTLFDPKNAQELVEKCGDDFKEAFCRLESQGSGTTIKARDLWNKIIESQIETGTPYMLYKDAANLKSNQQNLGTIKSSNLCTEIIEYTDSEESAVCNLASIGLPTMVEDIAVGGKYLNYDRLYNVARFVTRSLDNVIDINFYPTKETKRSNLRHRPIGIGVQGLADVFALLGIAFESDEAKELNRRIFETIYKGAIDESIKLAKEKGKYETYEGSPAQQGKLQFDLWSGFSKDCLFHDWSSTYVQLAKHGLRNSLLVAPMPTASTSQILGNNEAFEPFTSNIYVRRTLAGEFIVVNKYLVKELIKRGIWNEDIKNEIIRNDGSIQDIDEIPSDLKEIFKTVWEMSMKNIIDMASDRGKFICQSQSMNLFVSNPTHAKLTSMHFYGWEKGLKTGSYYIRSKAASKAIQFTISKKKEKEVYEEVAEVCNIDDPNCESCSG